MFCVGAVESWASANPGAQSRPAKVIGMSIFLIIVMDCSLDALLTPFALGAPFAYAVPPRVIPITPQLHHRGTVVVGCHVDASCGARRFAAVYVLCLCDPCTPSEISAVAKLIVARPSAVFPLLQSASPCATSPFADSKSASWLFAANA